MAKKVLKFGGTSMGDAEAMKKSLAIAKEHNATIVVVSASSGTTDQLIEILEKSIESSWDECTELVAKIKKRHYEIAKNLGVDDEKTLAIIDHIIEEAEALVHGANLLKEVSPRTSDDFQSIGERLSSAILSRVDIENTVLVDARDCVKTDDSYGRAEPDLEATKEATQATLKPHNDKIVITQGFIGMSPSGTTTTLGRGGSDYSAALLAEAIDADELHIWTDVSGVASTDPRIVEAATPIKDMSFQEAAEMANAGAKILYPPTMIPARRANIPVFVANTFAPDEGGTWIVDKPKETPLVRAITLKKDQCLVTLTTPKMVQVYGFLAEVFAIFASHKVSVDQVTTSETSVSVTLDDYQVKHKKLFEQLEKHASVHIESDFAVVSLIGNGINTTAGLAKEMFQSVNPDDNDITIRMISQGASKHNVCIMVKKDQAQDTVKRLHKTFIEEGVSL